jgi:hypothetical protein
MHRMAGALAAAALLAASPAGAVKTSYWKTEDVNQFLRGDATGVTIDGEGSLRLGLAVDSLVTRLEGVTYIWSLARSSKGTLYFGTGDNGSIYRLVQGGKPEPVWNTGAGEITALAVDAQDNLYAGSTPGGVVFRVGAKGDTTRYFETGEESVWSLLAGSDGALYVGTGSQGKVFRVTGPGKGSVFAETRDVNVLALAQAKDGALLAGTASKGLLWRIERSGAKRVIHDAQAEEIRGIAVLPDGSIAVGANRGRSGGGGGSGGGNPYAIEVTPSGGGGGGGGGGRCAVALVRPDGSARLLYAPPCEYLYALAPGPDNTVLAATGEPAALFTVGVDRKYSLLYAPEAKQIVTVLPTAAGTYVATGNAATLSVLGPGPAKSGVFLSDAKDLRSVAKWGRAMGIRTGAGEVTIATRSGLGETPDDGWSGWSAEKPLAEEPSVESPPARFLQYRLRFTGGAANRASIRSVEIAYQQENLPPELATVRIYGPSTPFFEGGPDYRPPQVSQVFPDGTKVEYSVQRSGPRQVTDAEATWVRGVRSAVWDASDPNGDDLSYDIAIKAEDEAEWRTVVENSTERAVSWDSQAMANGWYRMRVVASDRPDNPEAGALTAERTSAPFLVDNVPPRIEELSIRLLPASKGAHSRAEVRGTVTDADSRIGRIEYAVDGGDWAQVFPLDGIFDATREEFRFEVGDLEPGEHSVTVRAADLDRNITVGKVVTVTR